MSIIAVLQQSKFQNLFGKVVFFSLLALLAVVNIFGSFKGMSTPEAMEAATLGREIARGNGLSNKVIYPRAIFSSEERGEPLSLTDHTNTSTAPGYPAVNAVALALVGGDDFDKNKIKAGQHVYFPDRILAGMCMLFFLISIALNYKLAMMLFDRNIANVAAVMMLLSNMMWDYVQSCLPQMFLLMIFTLILILYYRAHLLFKQTGNTPWGQLLICAVLFGVMILTKWMVAWLFIGYLAAVLVHFKPKGIIATASVLVVVCMISPILFMNYKAYGSPLGLAGATLSNSVASSEEVVLRNFGETPVRLDGLILNVVQLASIQVKNLITELGGFVIAPIFFLSLIHLYKRESINNFKWAVLLIWVFGVIGMSIYGGKELTQSHSLHILFAPVFAMLAISVISILWSKTAIFESKSLFANAHLFIIVLLCGAPLLSELPQQVQNTFASRGKGLPNAPLYQTAELTNDLHNMVTGSQPNQSSVIYSDQPAATAWYSDVHSIALPLMIDSFGEIDKIAEAQGIQISGIHTSAISTRHVYENNTYNGIAPIVYLPVMNQIVGFNMNAQGVRPSFRMLDAMSYDRERWKFFKEAFPHSSYIRSSNRQEFKDFGLHMFHGRISPDQQIKVDDEGN